MTLFNTSWFPSSLVVVLAVIACGCQVPNQMYRPGYVPANTDANVLIDRGNQPAEYGRAVVTVPPPPKLPMQPNTAWPPHPALPCKDDNLMVRPCLAFLEFDDFGEAWQKNPSGRPTQLGDVTNLITKAKRQDPLGEPLILTFVHGWKHNASMGKNSGADDPNIIGLEAVLNRLHSSEWKNHVVIGIYIAWRGDLISAYWPISRQFTYWNREATAARVGNTSLTEALIEISDTARKRGMCGVSNACRGSSDCVIDAGPPQGPPGPAPRTSCTPLLLLVGHSFGALVLERALSQATATRMEREWNESREAMPNAASTTIPSVPITPLADLVIYINSAAAAIEAKQMLDYLASSHFVYRPGSGKDEPLFLSITSEADLATGILLKVGHAVPLLGYKVNGSMRGQSSVPSTGPAPGHEGASQPSYARNCFAPPQEDGNSWTKSDLTQSDFYMSTTAHLEPLWSHIVVQKPAVAMNVSNVPNCARSADVGVYATCHIGEHDYSVKPVEGRCNGTPYWVIQVQKEIIPDHGTIFTVRLIEFLIPFISGPAVPGSPGTRPQLLRPQNVE
jgi:hypothetical protein